METIRTDFSPSDHGFRFVNRFALPDSVTRQAVFGRRNPLRLDHLVYGLCGGMCFAARDFFGAHRPVPDTASVDEIGAELFMSVATVKAHVSRLLTKLELSNRVQIALVAHDSGLV